MTRVTCKADCMNEAETMEHFRVLSLLEHADQTVHD
eukprot:CAMPEP_0172879270 /NCGR_PEP_ID=MMETSP1075-20121228/112046_1 /TAXON_ID=2916 /ORGANISM="Ceratium fusus, Strain PA161109" /LENGTH=35 /DNA_ID= /DNA_START= /DNA_END= /DNA_ORIENTATION=